MDIRVSSRIVAESDYPYHKHRGEENASRVVLFSRCGKMDPEVNKVLLMRSF